MSPYLEKVQLMIRLSLTGLMLLSALSFPTDVSAAHKWNLKEGTPELKSAGALAFGPDGILFVGDPKGAAIFAVDTGDATAVADKPALAVEKLDAELAGLFGGAKVTVRDLAINPLSGNGYLSVTHGENNTPGLVRIDSKGAAQLVSLTNVPFLKATLPNPPEDKITGEGQRARNRRNDAITDLAFVDGRLLVAGLTAAEAPAALLQYPFPFGETPAGTNVEIYHAAHGRSEDFAAIRTFIPLTINGEPTLLAGFTCTPLVRFEVKSLQGGSKSAGTTVAELGNRNTPLDLVAYEKSGERYLLVANNNRGVLKVSTADIGRENGLTTPVTGGGTAGQSFERIAALDGTIQLERLDDTRAIVIVQSESVVALKTIALP
jgi:hypothetical protein